jgi:D-glycero-D-manno-heptose 1,7-bisphosphate phosphatase
MPEGRYVSSPSEFEILPGVPEAIARLNRARLQIVVVTNQRGIALGLYKAADVDAIHDRLKRVLAGSGAHVDGFYVCPHDHNQCNCRKPLPGLFEQAMRDFPAITPARSAIIGDSLSDIEAGRRLGLISIFLLGGGLQEAGAEKAARLADLRFSSLPEAVDSLLAVRTE